MPSIGSILIVDNEPAIVDLLVEILTDAGYVVYSAPDGTRALIAIARHPPGLIMLDVRNPGRQGAELIKHMREAVLATIPIVVTTTAPHDATPLLALGAAAYLAKPFDIDALLACVARFVQPAQTAAPSPGSATYPTAAA